jgi:hypothetical protein
LHQKQQIRAPSAQLLTPMVVLYVFYLIYSKLLLTFLGEEILPVFEINICHLQDVKIPLRLNLSLLLSSSHDHVRNHVDTVQIVDVVIVVVIIIVVVVVNDADDVENRGDADDGEGQELKGRKA